MAVATQEVYFDDVDIGTALPEREFGPHTLAAAVRWAGVQENLGLLHLDRDHVRANSGLKTIIASGALRQSLLTRMLTDWVGPRGRLRKMSIRHRASTFEGDMQRYAVKVVEKSPDPSDPWVDCEFEGRNQDGEAILTGKCTLSIPTRAWPADRYA
jgi:acyl dehydratase